MIQHYHRMRALVRRLLIAVLCLVALVTVGLCGSAAGQPGGPRFVDGAGQPLAGAQVRVLCYSAGSSILLVDLLVKTGIDGRPLQALPGGCANVAALRLLHTQPSGKLGHGSAYQVYTTSWPPGSRALQPASGDITIRDNWPLVLFNVVASLEWQPTAESDFAADLRQGLYGASAYLYDLSEGQMAIGPLEVSTDGRRWDAADLRFRAANDYRPSALVGGIVAARTPYTTTTGLTPVYAPGEIILGRFWDGHDAANPVAGRWSQQNAARTLTHEWGHYALFLYDEYQDTDANGKTDTYCTRADLPTLTGAAVDLAGSAMSYHYTAGELWLSGEPAVCLGTDQWRVHGEQDWETLLRWEQIQGLKPNWLHRPPTLTPGPSLGLAGDLFGRQPDNVVFRVALPFVTNGGSTVSPPAVFTPTVNLTISRTLTLDELDALYPQVYILEATTTKSPDRVLHQGTTGDPRGAPDRLGTIALLGVQPGGRARVFVDRYGPARAERGRFVYPPPGGSDAALADGQTLRLAPTTWRASLAVSYALTGPLLTTMTLTLTSREPLALAPTTWLCTPAAETGCPDDPAWRTAMQPSGASTWMATFTAPRGGALPHYGVLRVVAPGAGEIIRWFQAGGGVGPAHIRGDAPLSDGIITADATQPLSGVNNRLIFMLAASYDALVAPLPGEVAGIIGAPLDVAMLLPAGGAQHARASDPLSSAGADRTLPVSVTLTLFYSQDAVDRLGIDERQLQVLHFSRGTGAWSVVPTSGSSTLLNWLATRPVREDGIYAVGWRPAADLDLSGVARPDPASAGAVLTYTLQLHNAGPNATTATALTMQLSPQVMPLPAPAECEQPAPGRLICAPGALAVGETTILTIPVKVDQNAAGVLISVVDAASDLWDPNPTNNHLQIVTQVWRQSIPEFLLSQ